VCTTDACDPLTGVSHTPVSIDDNDLCTTDTCDPVTGVHHEPVTVDDNDACTTDACDPVTGISHTPVVIDDNNACTTDACDPVTGISHTPVVIDDNNACTTDTCDPNSGVHHEPVPVDDGDACTEDSCDPATGVITHADSTSIVVNLQVEALGHAVTRTVTFTLTECGVGTETRTVPVDFDASGQGTATLTDVNTTLDWIAAKEGHTLGAVLPLDFAGGCSATVSFTGGDNMLLAGDFSNWGWVAQDGLVDIQDFAILAVYWNQPVAATLGTQADATGDGLQDGGDFTAIQANFARVSDPPPVCPREFRSGRVIAGVEEAVEIDGFVVAMPVTAIAMPGVEQADRNGDGVIDLADIRVFAAEQGIILRPDFDARLRRLEWSATLQPHPGVPSGQ
jgi:uncharacterized Zn-binding protein involved in type VI secretion